jgi:hypothetical protein
MLPPRCLLLRVFAASLAGSVFLTQVGQAAEKGRREPKSPVAKAVAKARAIEARKAVKRAKAIAKAPDQPSSKNKTKATAVAARTTTSVSATKATGGPPMRAVAPAQPPKTAAELDRLLAAEVVAEHSSSLAPRASDEVFLRRVSLDIAGRTPTPEEITAFSLDPANDKRTQAVERLLAEEAYGQNWGRYWRDVVMYRRSDDRAMLAATALEEYLTGELNKNTPWDQIARAFITATGDVRENGNTAIFMAQMGETSDMTAEVSRIFMGIQIQCAQCHDHPTDRWKRSQFHELAAFFPRVGVQQRRNTDGPPTFEVVSADRGPLAKRPNANRPRPSLEHFMPDLQDPSARGTQMESVFFVTGQKLSPGATDMERRETIAGWMTAPQNPWFAKAFTNRIWSELVGEGFYEPVDDLGPDREATAPKTLDYLAAQFVANKHDIKWLFRTITATEAYQRASRSRRGPEETPFLATAAQRLRGDQLYAAVTSVLGTPVTLAGARAARYANVRDPRFIFNAVFGFDPSVRRDEITGSIPQALVVMNSPQLAAGINGRRTTTFLGKLLSEEKDDEAVAVELYLRALSREPTADELAICLAHVKDTGNRTDAFEDVLWALLNSAEFMHRK